MPERSLKITEEGKAMSSKLGAAGGTAHCHGQAGLVNPDQDQNTGAV